MTLKFYCTPNLHQIFIIKEHRIFQIEYFMTVFGKFVDGFTVFFYAKI
nr:MAG TPA: hypothetical protein [Caudoviricetes sp.]